MADLNFHQLIEKTALKLYDTYQKSANVVDFLAKKLPAKYGAGKGFLINKNKEISEGNIFIYNRLICPKLLLGELDDLSIFPANTVYGNISFFPELNQTTLETSLKKDKRLNTVYYNQLIDNQEDSQLLNIWLTTDLAPFLTINDLEDRLLAEESTPDLVIVINRGVLAILNESTIQNIFDLSAKKDAQSFDKAIAQDLATIANKTMQGKYMKIGADAAYKNCFYGYILLLELLKNQDLPKDGLAPELAAIW